MTDPRQTTAAFTRALEERMGGRVHSVVLYGSVARGEAVEGVSDINVLVLLDRVDSTALQELAPLARRWTESGNTAPLLMAEDEWRQAADVFAIELSDMKDAHDILHGRDPLTELTVEFSALRLQVERELRGKLIQLREGMLLSGDDQEAIGKLLLVALPSFLTYLRATLRLVDRPVPATSPEVLEQAGVVLGVDPAPLLRVWEARSRRRAVKASLDASLVNGYYAVAEKTAAFVDNL